MAVKHVRLGKSDLMVSRICFGCWQLSPVFWGDVPLPDWEKAVMRSVELGINFFDTADAYGEGYAETCLGNVMKREKLRDKIVLATKFYWNFTQGEHRYPDTRHDYIIQACEASLKRLQTDHIDLYQIHAWDPLTRPEEVGAALNRLRKEGKIRWIGVSNLNVEQMRMYLKYFDIQSLQPHYSLLTRDSENFEFPFCLEQGMGVIGYSPLERGLLTGKYARDQKFDDPRDGIPKFSGQVYQRILDGVDQLRPLAAKHGLTMGQFAIRWILTHPAVTAPILGVKKAEHLETMLPALDAPLPPLDWHQAAKIMEKVRKDIEQLMV